VEEERIRTAEALGERTDEFMQLKVEGINDCAEVLVAALMDDREKHIFGRRTLPEMDMASLSCAIQNLWLASRAEGLGMGWVSLFEPQALADLLGLPSGAKPLAVCAWDRSRNSIRRRCWYSKGGRRRVRSMKCCMRIIGE
jgi:5,6-dimethylbenzimidazole synthase